MDNIKKYIYKYSITEYDPDFDKTSNHKDFGYLYAYSMMHAVELLLEYYGKTLVSIDLLYEMDHDSIINSIDIQDSLSKEQLKELLKEKEL